jgi:hypothetical protein
MSRGYPQCGLCRQPVACGQGSWHYTCLGMCSGCYQRPVANPDVAHCGPCMGKAVVTQ